MAEVKDKTGTAGGHMGPHHSQPHSRPYATFDGVPKNLPLKAPPPPLRDLRRSDEIPTPESDAQSWC
ncbi:MAG TPA: hypothetical protein VK140_11105 [Ktedonobacteraceae bacterium]|nr:hypothetical protein [Ktedonobacteraceae bacterium]